MTKVKNIFLLGACLLLWGCGQAGNLYLPQANEVERANEIH